MTMYSWGKTKKAYTTTHHTNKISTFNALGNIPSRSSA